MLFVSSLLCQDEELTESLLNFLNPICKLSMQSIHINVSEVLTEKGLGGLPLRLLGCTM